MKCLATIYNSDGSEKHAGAYEMADGATVSQLVAKAFARARVEGVSEDVTVKLPCADFDNRLVNASDGDAVIDKVEYFIYLPSPEWVPSSVPPSCSDSLIASNCDYSIVNGMGPGEQPPQRNTSFWTYSQSQRSNSPADNLSTVSAAAVDELTLTTPVPSMGEAVGQSKLLKCLVKIVDTEGAVKSVIAHNVPDGTTMEQLKGIAIAKSEVDAAEYECVSRLTHYDDEFKAEVHTSDSDLVGHKHKYTMHLAKKIDKACTTTINNHEGDTPGQAEKNRVVSSSSLRDQLPEIEKLDKITRKLFGAECIPLSLYDAKTDNQVDLQDGAVADHMVANVHEFPSYDVQFKLKEGQLSLAERIAVLDMSNEQMVSNMVGLTQQRCPFDKYLMNDASRVSEQETAAEGTEYALTLHCTYTTHVERVEKLDPAHMEKIVSAESFDQATHLVTEVIYGGQVVFEFSAAGKSDKANTAVTAAAKVTGHGGGGLALYQLKSELEKLNTTKEAKRHTRGRWVQQRVLSTLSPELRSQLRVGVYCHADIMDQSDGPISFDEAWALLQDLHSLKLASSSRRDATTATTTTSLPSIPLEAKMIAVESFLRDECVGDGNRLTPLNSFISSTLPLNELMQSALFAHKIVDTVQRVQHMLSAHHDCCQEVERSAVLAEASQFLDERDLLLAECADVVVKIRSSWDAAASSSGRIRHLSNELATVLKHGAAVKKQLRLFLDHTLAQISIRILMAEQTSRDGGVYIGSSNHDGRLTDWEQLLASASSCYVLLCDAGRLGTVERVTDPNVRLFFDMLRKQQQASKRSEQKQRSCGGNEQQRPRRQFIVVDVATAAQLPPDATPLEAGTTARIVEFRDGQLHCADYIVEHGRKRYTCLVRSKKVVKAATPGRNSNQPAEDSVLLEVACPLSLSADGRCTRNDWDCWECDDCGEVVRFDKRSKRLFCKCGWSELANLSFRCKESEAHGEERFICYQKEQCNAIIDQHSKSGEINVALFGLTGVGKSTLANSMALYMTYEQLEDAMAADDLPTLIPARFTLSEKGADGIYRKKEIIIGNDDSEAAKNENLAKKNEGQSSTQLPRAHVLNCMGGKLRLIDPPGVGDTSGMDQDRKNFDATLDCVSNVKELHGILVLMKPNDPRADILFRYAISEVLTHLHKDAAKNIIFIFTNAKGTGYKLGETLVPLQQYLETVNRQEGVNIQLSDDTCFCFENDPFRFLWAMKSGVQYPDNEIAEYREAWRKSQAEMQRLIKRLTKMKPHRTQDSVTLNEGRRVVTLLGPPIARAMQMIQANMTDLADKQQQLRDNEALAADLQARAKVPHTSVRTTTLGHHRTVCTSNCCTELVGGQVVYKTHCHPHCHLDQVVPNRLGDETLVRCAAMGGTSLCQTSACKCSYKMHMHITYSQEVYTEYVDCEQIQQLLADTNDKRSTAEKLIAGLSNRRVEFEYEQARITTIAAHCVIFLKRNTIAIDYDAIISYMEMFIREEERAAAIRGDYRRVEGLRSILDNYRDEKQFYDSEVSKGAKNISANDIKAYYKELISLPLMGSLIKDIFEEEERGRLDASKYAENRYKHQVVRRASTLPRSHLPEQMFPGGYAATPAYPMPSGYGAAYSNGPSIHNPSYIGQHAPRDPTVYDPQPPMMGNLNQFNHNYNNYLHYQHQYMDRDGSSQAQWGYGAPTDYHYPHQAPPPRLVGNAAGLVSGGSGAGKPGPSKKNNRDLSDEKVSNSRWFFQKFF